jgi:ornithine carbamoyltransferase
MLVAASVGSRIRIATPRGHEPAADIVAHARKRAKETGGSVELFVNPVEAVAGANAIYTDVWASMGQEEEATKREKIFADYQVNRKLMSLAAPGALFLHCLPAHRGLEVTDEVIDSPQSVVFDQAENRLHIQKAIMLLLLGGGKHRLPIRSANA